MSSPHPDPENATPPAPLTPTHADSSPAGPPAQEHHGHFSASTLLDGATFPSRPGDPDLADDLKSRAATKQSSRSLLTQALASARGIPPPAPTTPQQDGPDRDKPSAPPDPLASPDKSSSSLRSHGHVARRDGDVGPPLLSAAPGSVAMVAPVTTSVAGREHASVPFSCKQLVLPYTREVSLNHGDLDRSRASTSLELDRSTSNSLHANTFPHSSGPNDSMTPTKASSFESFESTPTHMTRDMPRKSGPSPHRPRFEQALTRASEKNEKVWSIGSGPGDEEDGLVEQSVAEAMAGVEHNARSRKASYSLRFFKEGLPPDDKGRRKDAKPSQREKLSPAVLSPAVEEDAGTPSDVSSETSTPPASRTLFMSSADGQASHPFSLQTDYFDVRGIVATTRVASPTGTPVPMPIGQEGVETSMGPGQAVESESEASEPEPASDTRVRSRREGSDAEGDTHVEADADDSGEEKISSAVFLPHQEMPEARMKSGDGVDLVRTPRPRSLSQSKTHPWLVKADEPEPDPEIHVKDESAFGSPTLHSRETPVPRKGDVSLQPSDECAVEEELEVKSPMPARVVTRCEAHVHEHQHHSRKPLEAIELIPYKHQVGGHTTLWRFSRRAVCKQLNNRENEFYETIERYHRDLLPFLPRYVSASRSVIYHPSPFIFLGRNILHRGNLPYPPSRSITNDCRQGTLAC